MPSCALSLRITTGRTALPALGRNCSTVSAPAKVIFPYSCSRVTALLVSSAGAGCSVTLPSGFWISSTTLTSCDEVTKK